MLDRARRKAALMNIRNVEFVEMDMRNIVLPAGHFDVATCAFGIFLLMIWIHNLFKLLLWSGMRDSRYL